MRVAVVGCAHGELDKIYETIAHIEAQRSIRVDLLICCGDFQAVRNPGDLACMACPVKYRAMNTFYKYYSGEKRAPVLTLYVAGNHEASNYHMELFHGGWVAPNIWYMGAAGVVRVGGLRIAGLSGIYNRRHFGAGHFERLPLDRSTERSAYHVRAADVERLLRLRRGQGADPIDIFVSHDWPLGVHRFGNERNLVRRKRHLRDEVRNNALGNPAHAQLLGALRPRYWFSAHLHVKFPALVPHPDGSRTRFLALGKCLPSHDFLQILDISPQVNGKGAPPQAESKSRGDRPRLLYDPEWLAVIRKYNGFVSTDRHWQRTGPSDDPAPPEPSDVRDAVSRLGGEGAVGEALPVPLNFVQTAAAWDGKGDPTRGAKPAGFVRNPQTATLLRALGVRDAIGEYLGGGDLGLNDEEIDIGASSSSADDPLALPPLVRVQTDAAVAPASAGVGKVAQDVDDPNELSIDIGSSSDDDKQVPSEPSSLLAALPPPNADAHPNEPNNKRPKLF